MFEKAILSRLVKAGSQFAGRNAFFINGSFHTYGELWDLIGKIRTQLRDITVENARVALSPMIICIPMPPFSRLGWKA